MHSLKNEILLDLIMISKEQRLDIVTDTSRRGIFVPLHDIEKNTQIMMIFRVCERRYRSEIWAEEKQELLATIEKAFLSDLKDYREKQLREEKNLLTQLQNGAPKREKKSSKKWLAFSLDSL